MKMRYATLSALIFGLSFSAYAKDNVVKKPESSKEKISYSIGLDIGKNFKSQDIDLDLNIFMQGLKDGHEQKQPLLTDDEIRQTLMELQSKLIARQAEELKKLSENNLAEGAKFLAENKKKKGIVTTKSGLQYKIINEGKGASPKETDKVRTHYKGTLVDGTEFDSSYKRGEPVEFAVNGVIKGWTEALQLMKPGAKWELFIPADLAYGESGAGNVIGPNATLIFEVELLKVLDSDKKSG